MTSPGTPEPPRPVPGRQPAPLYRAKAVQALDSTDRLDQLLPVTSLRLWLIAVAAAILVLGGVAYAAVTPRNVTVTGGGRIVDKGGVTLVTASVPGQFGKYTVAAGSKVELGQLVGYVVSGDRKVPQRAQRAGTLLGYLLRPGDPVDVGEWIAEIARKVDDGTTALMMVDPDEAAKLVAGQPVTLSVIGGPTVSGQVGPQRSGALSPARVQEGLGLLEPPSEPMVVIELDLDEPAPPGVEFEAVVLVSERTLLRQLLGMS